MAVEAERTVTIAAAPDRVLAVVRDVADQPSWWPGVRSSEVLEHDDQGRVLRATIGSDVKVATDTFEVAYTHTDNGVSWELVGSSLAQRHQRGSWTLAGADDPASGTGTTDVTLRLELEASLPLPKLVQRRIVRDTVVGALAGLKARCEA